VVISEILEEVISVQQRFCGNSRNSGIDDLGQTELLWYFQKFWNRLFVLNRASVIVPEIPELVICDLGQTELLW
jgi:hypothetical protein